MKTTLTYPAVSVPKLCLGEMSVPFFGVQIAVFPTTRLLDEFSKVDRSISRVFFIHQESFDVAFDSFILLKVKSLIASKTLLPVPKIVPMLRIITQHSRIHARDYFTLDSARLGYRQGWQSKTHRGDPARIPQEHEGGGGKGTTRRPDEIQFPRHEN